MSPEHELNNIASWKTVLGHVERFPENASWTPWKAVARRFVCEGINLGLDRYFRAGTSVNHLLFSTLDRNGLKREPRVTVEIRGENKLRIAYGATNLFFSSAELEYLLPYELGFPTFRRFLNQLWIETVADPLPDELRGFSAPILTPNAE